MQKILLAIMIGFFLCAGAAYAESGGKGDPGFSTTIQSKIKDATRKWQGCEYERSQLRVKFDALGKEQAGYAAEATALQKELEALTSKASTAGVKPAANDAKPKAKTK